MRSRNYKVTATIYVVIDEDHECEITAKATVGEYDPGVAHGPVENCYPPEGGEVEFEEILAGGVMKIDPHDFAKVFGEDALDQLEQAAFEEAHGT